MPNKYKVYMHTIPSTGKRYIGCTKQKLSKRFQNGYGYEKNPDFFRDIQLHGWESVRTEILASVNDRELALFFEGAAIERYCTLDEKHGYNLWSSGNNNKPDKRVGRNISAAKMGHEVRQEVREKLSCYGRRSVVCLSMDDNFIKEYSSITKAAKAVGAFKSNIWAVCDGRKRSCKGYKWVFADRWNNAKRMEERDRVKHMMTHERR